VDDKLSIDDVLSVFLNPIQEALEEGPPLKRLVKQHERIVFRTGKKAKDRDKLLGIDMFYKLHSAYAPEKIQIMVDPRLTRVILEEISLVSTELARKIADRLRSLAKRDSSAG
jgi:hypothetical protein